MLKIKSILFIITSVFFFSTVAVSAQVTVTGATNYYGGGFNNPNTINQVGFTNNSQKYPELCAVLSRSLIPGDTGNDVRRLQVALGQEGIAYIGSTGFFGPVTRNAVQVFQLRNGIRQTGNVGPQTMARIRQLWCGGQTGGAGNIPTGYINPINNNDFNTNNNGQLEVSIAPISSFNNDLLLGWNARNAISCDLNGERVNVNGQRVYNIQTETTYTINCVGTNNSRTGKSIVLRPNQTVANLPNINLSINPTSALVNTTATLFWTSTNTNSCTLNGQNVSVSGSQQILVTNTQVAYQLTCSNFNGQRVSATVYSNPGASTVNNISSASIFANTSSVNSGQPVTLTWSSINTSSCSITGGTSNFSGVSGSQVVYPTQNTVYTISCIPTTSGPQVTNQVVVNVNGTNTNNNLTISAITNKTNYSVGENLILNVSVRNNTNANISYLEPICALYGPFSITVDGTDFYSFLESGQRAICLAFGNSTINLAPNETKNYSYTAPIANKSFTNTSKNIQVSWNNNSGQTGTTNTTFTINNSGNTNNVTTTLSANPTTIASVGQPVTLTWSSTNASYCNIINSAGTTVASNQSTAGTFTVYPTASGNYQLSCFNNSGQSNLSTVFVTLTGSSVPTTVTVNPTTNTVGNSTNITWSISTTTSPQGVTLSLIDSNNNFFGNITRINSFASSSSFTWTIPKVVFDTSNDGISCITVDNQQFCGGSPKQVVAGTYKVRVTLFTPSNACFGFCQPVSGQRILGTYDSANFTINTSASSNLVTTTLSSNPNTVGLAQASVLSWTSTNATYCNILNSTGSTVASNQSTSGTFTVYPTVSGNYQVMCFNSGGQSNSSYSFVTVNGGISGNVTATLSATPNPVTSGQPVTLTWSSTNANYCNISANNTSILNNQGTSGSTVVFPSISTNYQINCFNNNGQNAANFAYVTINNNFSLTPTASLNSSTQSISSGQPVTLNWFSSNANTCSIFGNNNLIISNQNTSGSYLIYPTQTTNYQVTCTNNSSGQTANAYVTVTVNGGNGANSLSLLSNVNRQVTVQVNNSTCSANTFIMWGNGLSSTVPAQCGTVTLSHVYSYSGNFNINLWTNGVSGNILQVFIQ